MLYLSIGTAPEIPFTLTVFPYLWMSTYVAVRDCRQLAILPGGVQPRRGLPTIAACDSYRSVPTFAPHSFKLKPISAVTF